MRQYSRPLAPVARGFPMVVGPVYVPRAMLAACAMMVPQHNIEVQITDDNPALKFNPKFYGWGDQRPVGEMPFKIWKREA